MPSSSRWSEREALVKRLAEEERLGSLGRLTSALAHEINNPLGGLFNSLATLKSHGHIDGVRTSALGILERGLIGIRDVVRTTLAMYRSNQASRDLTATDIDDLGLLLVPEARRRSLSVSVTNRLQDDVPLPSTPIRQAVLNLLLNAVAAGPEGSDVLLDVGSRRRKRSSFPSPTEALECLVMPLAYSLVTPPAHLSAMVLASAFGRHDGW